MNISSAKIFVLQLELSTFWNLNYKKQNIKQDRLFGIWKNNGKLQHFLGYYIRMKEKKTHSQGNYYLILALTLKQPYLTLV